MPTVERDHDEKMRHAERKIVVAEESLEHTSRMHAAKSTDESKADLQAAARSYANAYYRRSRLA